MNAEMLFEFLGDIDEQFIREAEHKKIVFKQIFVKKRALIAAACLTLVVAISVYIISLSGKSALPNLTINLDGSNGGMGFESVMAHDINELESGNPWNENSKIKTLPVFENPIDYKNDGKFNVGGLSYDEMVSRIENTAKAMAFTIISVSESDSTVTATCNDGIKITMSAVGALTIRYGEEKPLKLPEGYLFSDNITKSKKQDIMRFILQAHSGFISLKSPKINANCLYTVDDIKILFNFSLFEGDGSITDQIINYNFKSYSISLSEDMSGINSVSKFSADLSKKIGDYPIISPSKAKKLLLNKKYVTTVPNEFPDEKFIAKSELVYRSDFVRDKIFMPYYKFWVELPDMRKDSGLKTFGLFYVPAVEEKYITNMPLWDGDFN